MTQIRPRRLTSIDSRVGLKWKEGRDDAGGMSSYVPGGAQE